MDYYWFFQVILIFLVGTFILRIGGRKSISQMTIPQTIVMIGLGSLLIQPITGKGLLATFIAAFIIIILMVLTEYLQVKVDFFENIFSGKSIIVIENGKLNIKNMKKIRMTVDKLETRLRQAGISSIEDVKYATIEVSGQVGYELKEDKKPLTVGEFKSLINEIMINSNVKFEVKKNIENNIFEELNNKKFESNENEP
ncbi:MULTISPECIES: DUF421 domain-containing protein [Clostridium]|uniref:DUF421 domain-containing protein n=1 Tax=Clostridium sporogenes TaxID=1509 RepID=A0A7X5P9P9_CLOSG|nr:YetF domain-containing protein [Clostridium sporogenes]AJD30192.1 hypothetical protein T258_1005 [Clostridium botulinum Prevot_594]KRU42356.1 hypothetical protein VT94_15820 [Clostridium sporogenes]MBY7016377.1 DUF421 domain-containing protein [Clostridium sporogenes]MBY7065291.1 DUF421 domain-containing protein [Clostridium sporogenes]MBY7070593.1 DUF421 domain-containing protein [Clostridium sporogenes]